MSFRVLKLCLYARHSTARRELAFNSSGLSIVTGVSRRGKSAILAIADYLLASRSCSIPRGVVRDTVAHVGGLFERADGVRMVVTRPIPRVGNKGSSEIHVQTGYGLELPPGTVDGRWNLRTARDRISEFAGIESLPLLTTKTGDDEEDFSVANIRHVAPFLFQPQDVIASRMVSFAGLEDFWTKRHVLDALDYFLGVFNAELLSLRSRLRQLEAEHRRAKRKMAEIRKLGADGYTRGQRLLAQAIAVGLAPDGRADSIDDIRTLLRATQQQPESISAEQVTASGVPAEAIEAERAARSEYYNIQHRIAQLEAEMASAGAHSQVVATGLQRIRLRELVPQGEPGECPVCGSAELGAGDLNDELEAAAQSLGREQAVPVRLHTEMENQLTRLRKQLADSRSRMRAAQRSLRALFKYLSERRSVLDEIRRRERLRGQIDAYLSATAELQDSDSDSINKIVAEIDSLEAQLRKQDWERRRAQEELEDEVTAIARELDVEFEEPARVGLASLAIQVRSGADWAHLEEFGSGANWVSYHVAAALGLGKTFIARSSPVPQFIMFDQPSQAWFPPDSLEGGRAVPLDSDDREAVARLYKVLAKHADLKHGPQVIVMDHARLAEPWFKRRVIADWHDGSDALVPADWIE